VLAAALLLGWRGARSPRGAGDATATGAPGLLGRPAAGRLAVAAAAVVATVVLGIAWAGGDDTVAASPPAGEGGGAVTIASFSFGPDAVSVPAGATVTWTNHDPFEHSVVAQDGTFQSQDLSPGQSFAHAFTAPGTYQYVCGIHPTMHGTVTVT
jgi:plastocyanin